jgi:hypothetical protein
MAVLSDNSRSFRAVVGRHGSTLACALFVLSVLLGAALDRSLPIAVYLLSFWHYHLYWLAFAYGRPSFRRRREGRRRHRTVDTRGSWSSSWHYLPPAGSHRSDDKRQHSPERRNHLI